ncbi:Transmembrane protein 132E [Schistosoma japonicum]|nr:Transmembrane protein 132E [Schistosoma japonicum]
MISSFQKCGHFDQLHTIIIEIYGLDFKTTQLTIFLIMDGVCVGARFEIPPNTYVEFVRVIWPPGVNTVTSSSSSPHIPMSSITSGDANSYIEINEFHDTQIGSTMEASEKNDMRSRNMWDVFHRSVINSKRNVTEIIARFREDLVTTNPTSKYSSATEIYKLQFRVNKPQSSSPGRVAPRIFWSLASLSRRNSPDHTISGSPVVTRLNIEPSEFKHITMVLKKQLLKNG